jgi:hypothetical protein
MYVDALALSLNTSFTIEASRLTWSILQHFVEAPSHDAAAAAAVVAVRDAIEADASLVVRSPDNSIAFTAGAPFDEGDDAAVIRRVDALRAPVDPHGRGLASLEIRPRPGRSFSQREAQLFDVAVANFRTWFSGAGGQLGSARERRRATRPFNEIVDACLKGESVSPHAALVLLSPEASSGSAISHAWIKRVRTQLRPTDLAGRLASGEVAVLALDTSAAGARVLAHRIARLLASSSEFAQVRMRVGFAATGGETLSVDSLVDRARAQVVDTSTAAG